MATIGAIKVTTSLSVTNGALAIDNVASRTQSITQTTAKPSAVGGTQSIGNAAHEAIVITELTTLGWCRFRNMDPTNYVEIGLDVAATFYPLVRIETGEECIFRMAQGITPYAQANTAAVILAKTMLDD